MTRTDRLAAVVERELWTAARTRSLLAVAAGFVLVVLALGGMATGGTGGYVAVALDLLTPLELLVPLLGFAFGYRAVRGDAERGELAVLRTYPLTAGEYILGTFLGRAAVVVATTSVGLLAAGAFAALAAPSTVHFLATHTAGDTLLVFVRFLTLTAAYAAVGLALALAVSAVARSVREALALAAVVLVAVGAGLDLALVAALGRGLVGEGGAVVAVALSPASAYRGLVLTTVAGPSLSGPTPASPAVSAVGLVGWLVLALAIAISAVRRT